MSNYLPFGFVYPKGFAHSETNPDPLIEDIRTRMKYWNNIHDLTSLPGHIFTAALYLFQSESSDDPFSFWHKIRSTLTDEDVATIITALAPKVQNEPCRLEFPNSTALFDCRFISTKEWEHIRRYSIGGSEVAAILGLSHFQSSQMLFYEKKHPVPKPHDSGLEHILDYGHAVEDYVITEIADRLGAVQYPEYRMFAHKKYPFITCNPDGILKFPNGDLALFEAKTAMWLKREDWKDGIPSYYDPQPRQYMEVLDDPRINIGFIGVCLGSLPKDMICHCYSRDKNLGEEQINEVVKFWNNYIVPDITPPFSGNHTLDLDSAYKLTTAKKDAESTFQLPQSTVEYFETYFDLQQRKAELGKKLRKAIRLEKDYLMQIKNTAADGITISSEPDALTYKVEVKDRKRTTVNNQYLYQNCPRTVEYLIEIVEKHKLENSAEWTVPQITKSTTTKKRS